MKASCFSSAALILLLTPLTSSWLHASPVLTSARLRNPCVSNYPSTPNTQLFSTPRKPRRELQKRRKRRENQEQAQVVFRDEDSIWNTGEVRPMVKEYAKEQGLDYWIPQDDLERYQQIEEARRRREPGQVSNEKLMTEVLSPYRQNWIGLISVAIVAIAAVIKNFPELLNTPTISIPDL